MQDVLSPKVTLSVPYGPRLADLGPASPGLLRQVLASHGLVWGEQSVLVKFGGLYAVFARPLDDLWFAPAKLWHMAEEIYRGPLEDCVAVMVAAEDPIPTLWGCM